MKTGKINEKVFTVNCLKVILQRVKIFFRMFIQRHENYYKTKIDDKWKLKVFA